MPLSRYCPENYHAVLNDKTQHLTQLLAPFYQQEITVYASEPSHFRMRAEFRFWHEEGDAYYAMFPQGQNINPTRLDEFPIAALQINALMARVRAAILDEPILRERLFQVEFLCGLSGDSLVTLIYHKALDAQWQALAEKLQTSIGTVIIGRSKKQKIVLSRDYINEVLTVNGQQFHYRQVEGSFTQPNAGINQQMIHWAGKMAGHHVDKDFLELYCGNGNFTLPLSSQFRQVLATEISKSSVNSAQHNLAKNNITNTKIVRLSSEEFTQALNGERSFQRLTQQGVTLTDYDFSTVLVDPPRAGLDDETLQLIKQFEQIIYISCNPQTLADNLSVLQQSHEVKQAALFDQFPYTDHIEAGIYLSKRK